MTDLFIKKSQTMQTLDEFVNALPNLLGCGSWEQRESSNWPENRYFHCFALGLQIHACVADHSEFREYDFHLYFKPELWRSDSESLGGLADCVARKLVVSGYEVLRPFDSSRSGKGGLRYRFDPAVGTNPGQQVLTESI
jgi:hypothetical protein